MSLGHSTESEREKSELFEHFELVLNLSKIYGSGLPLRLARLLEQGIGLLSPEERELVALRLDKDPAVDKKGTASSLLRRVISTLHEEDLLFNQRLEEKAFRSFSLAKAPRHSRLALLRYPALTERILHATRGRHQEVFERLHPAVLASVGEELTEDLEHYGPDGVQLLRPIKHRSLAEEDEELIEELFGRLEHNALHAARAYALLNDELLLADRDSLLLFIESSFPLYELAIRASYRLEPGTFTRHAKTVATLARRVQTGTPKMISALDTQQLRQDPDEIITVSKIHGRATAGVLSIPIEERERKEVKDYLLRLRRLAGGGYSDAAKYLPYDEDSRQASLNFAARYGVAAGGLARESIKYSVSQSLLVDLSLIDFFTLPEALLPERQERIPLRASVRTLDRFQEDWGCLLQRAQRELSLEYLHRYVRGGFTLPEESLLARIVKGRGQEPGGSEEAYLWINPRTDYNGAFELNMPLLGKLSRRGIIHVLETDSAEDLMEQLQAYRKRVFCGVVLSAHGQPTFATLGKRENLSYSSLTLNHRFVFRRIGGLLKEGGSFIWNSCSIGDTRVEKALYDLAREEIDESVLCYGPRVPVWLEIDSFYEGLVPNYNLKGDLIRREPGLKKKLSLKL